MSENELKGVERIRQSWNNHARTFDKWYKTFQGAVENCVDLELLKKYLPKDKNARILDAAGGTGRISLPLVKMGYSVTLCDISTGMLDVAKQKMLREGVLDKIEILECDIRRLYFADESFDFVLCWNGAIGAARELIRVTKKGGRISIFLINKWASVINGFHEDSDSNLTSIESIPYFVKQHGERLRAFSPEEARDFFEREGIRVLDIYGVCGWLSVLGIPRKVQKARDWKERFLKQTTELVLKLSKEPSIKGMSKHLVLYGERM
nr:methyltransferase domain-containing protein [Candidatus Njordarchaeum guaymaensis]